MMSMWQGSSEKGSLWSRSSIWRATLCAWDPAAMRCLRTIGEYAGESAFQALGRGGVPADGSGGQHGPGRGLRTPPMRKNAEQALADSLAGMSFTKVKGKGLMRFVNEAVDLPYPQDSITAELVRHHADSLVRTSSKVSASFGEDVETGNARFWKGSGTVRFQTGYVTTCMSWIWTA